jgi:hypothetical protein
MTSSPTISKNRELDVLLLLLFFTIPFFNKYETAIISVTFFFTIVEGISKKGISRGTFFLVSSCAVFVLHFFRAPYRRYDKGS